MLWSVDTANVRRFTVDVSLDSSGVAPPLDAEMVVDGWGIPMIELAAVVDASKGQGATICVNEPADDEGVGQWALCSPSPMERGPSSYGPLRQALESEFVIVYGAGNVVNQRHAVYIANLFQLTTEGRASVASDADLPGLLAGERNFVLIGGPDENRLTAKLLQQQPTSPPALAINGNGGNGGAAGGVRVGPCNFEGPGVGVAALLPAVSEDCSGGNWFSCPTTLSPKQRLALVLAGSDAAGLASAVELATPTIPPMVRSPFSNTLPDYVVTTREVKSLGAGGIVAAGYWGNGWEYRRDSSYSAYCRRPTVDPDASTGEETGIEVGGEGGIFPDDLDVDAYLTRHTKEALDMPPPVDNMATKDEL